MELKEIIEAIGYPGMFFSIFAETGLFFGFIFPGESMLITAGVLAAAGYFDIRVLSLLFFVAAVSGDSFGYYTGRRFGRGVFSRQDSWFFHKSHVERAEAFYQAHGAKAIVFSRFIPVVRSLTPILAGIGRMHYARFMVFNVLGAFLWAVALTLGGYYLASRIPSVEDYLAPTIALFALIYLAVHLVASRAMKKKSTQYF